MRTSKKVKRRDLIRAITEIQNLIGAAAADFSNDRDPLGPKSGRRALDRAMRLCVEATSTDTPPTSLEMACFRTKRFQIVQKDSSDDA